MLSLLFVLWRAVEIMVMDEVGVPKVKVQDLYV